MLPDKPHFQPNTSSKIAMALKAIRGLFFSAFLEAPSNLIYITSETIKVNNINMSFSTNIFLNKIRMPWISVYMSCRTVSTSHLLFLNISIPTLSDKLMNRLCAIHCNLLQVICVLTFLCNATLNYFPC